MSNNTETNKEILVLGGTGKTGSRVAERLWQSGHNVRIGSRSAQPAFDWHNSDTWPALLQGAAAVYVSYHPDVAIPGTSEIIKRFVTAAKENGRPRLVLLSGRGEEEAEICEKVVTDSGLEWTIVRASWFCQNFSEGAFVDQILSGYVALPAGDTKEPFVDADDIADVAAAALTEDGHQGKIYEVTGPRLLTFREAVGEIAKAAGRDISFEQIPAEEFAAVLKEFRLPEEIVWLLNYLFSEVLDGRNEKLTDGVQQALGRQPTDFSEYARKAALTGVWNTQYANGE